MIEEVGDVRFPVQEKYIGILPLSPLPALPRVLGCLEAGLDRKDPTVVKDPTRAALNPGLCNEVAKRLHEWATHNDQSIAAIIAGNTHRAVFENLSLTERRHLESKVKTEDVKIKHQPDESYYNTGSCVHSLCITGIEITFENGPRLRLVKWGQATEGNVLTIQRTVLEETEPEGP